MKVPPSYSPRRSWLERHSHIVAMAILLLALLGYVYHLDSWRMYDDEGQYLYAAWRISEGETPYSDFLAEQMPVFLSIGGAVMRMVGPSALGLRLVTVGVMLLAAWLLYLVVKDALDAPAALFSLVVFLAHRNVYYMARFFRSEAYMVLFDLLGLYLGLRFYRRGKVWLTWGAGMAFALATLSKLFGLLPFLGYLLFLFLGQASSQRQFGAVMRPLVGAAVGFIVVLAAVLMPLYLVNPDLPEFLLGHHLRQGVDLSWDQVFINGMGFLWNYVLLWPVYVLLAAMGAVVVWRRRATWPLAMLFLAQLPTAGIFLFISRPLHPRLLIFLAPAGSVLMAQGVRWMVGALSARLPSPVRRVAGVITGLCLTVWAFFPHFQQDFQISQWQDRDTLRIARLLSEQVAPDEYMLCDYAGLNFYTQRKTTYLGAGLSGGAVGGSQITGYALARELESQPYQGRRWVVIDVSPETGHTMTGLHDYAWFLEYLVGGGFEVVDELTRGEQVLRVYRAPHQPLSTDVEVPLQIALGEDIQLLGYHLPQASVKAGMPVPLTLYWQANEPIDADLKVFVHLLDSSGNLRAQEDSRPRYGRFPTYLWTPGPVIVDEHLFSLPSDLAAGTYALGVGLYPWPDGPRLPAVGMDGQRLPDEWIALAAPVIVR